ncbi:sugar ABC transporter ATP-binding protein [Pseudoclavibacter terrae]|uniref:sugar ABC transporter ATP-binding protein n=1 Tax=Pseudoclavibacter terrae TaxID=1530195 RepID=UPI00232FB4CC|nr:sugar ABC transporter ATP-binding protein [Pseudoclavibacter terrae]
MVKEDNPHPPDEATPRRPILRMTGVSKRFPGVKALDDMQLTLYPGEVLALVGENGAGKSTLMKLLSGIYTPDAGVIEVEGVQVDVAGPKHASELGIQIIHQEFQLVNELTVAENIYLGREPRKAGLLSNRELNREAQDLFDRLGIRLDPTAPVASLSVASQQMVEIAKALSHDAKVLIMDEPTAALNDAEVAVLHDLIRGFVTDSTAVIYISHRMDELKQITQRVQVIRDGQFVQTAATADTTMREVVALMVGREVPSDARPTEFSQSAEVSLRVRGLSTRNLLRDISFDLRKGEILGIAGLVGAGRTELARAIVGADPITSGEIEVHGAPVRLRTPADAARKGVGYLSEDRKHLGLVLDQDVSSNIVLSALSDRFAQFGFLKVKAQRETSHEMVERLRIKTPGIGAFVKNLSGGNQQKVVIAKWIVKECDVLIFDEPTRGIDVGAKDEIYRLLASLAAQGKSLIVISSELPEVLRLSHRVLVMSEGRMTGSLEGDEVSQENIMHLATLRTHNEAAVYADALPTNHASTQRGFRNS